MSNEVLSIVIDTKEPRIKRSRLSALVTGAKDGRLQWDIAQSSNIFVDFVTFTGILQPVQVSTGWQSMGSGAYARLKKADYSLTSAKWVEHNFRFDGDTYLYGLDAEGDEVTTLQTWEKNQGFWFSYFAFGQNDNFAQLQVILGNIGLSFFSDGTVEIYKGVSGFADFTLSNYLDSGNLSKLQTEFGQKSTATGASGNNLNGAPIDILILPGRHRELTILSNRGGGFSYVFEDIAQDDPDPTITTAGVMKWVVPSGQADVQAAPLRMGTDGYLLSTVLTLRKAPEVGATATCQVYAEGSYFGVPPTATARLMNVDGTTNFVGDGSKTQCRLRVDLHSDGTNTPFVYGASATFAEVTQDTNDSEKLDLTPYVVSAKLDVPESPAGVTFEFAVKNVPEIAAQLAHLKEMGNRPVEAKIGTVPLFIGRTGDPEYEDAVNPKMETVTFKCRDPWKAFETTLIEDPLPLDTVRFRQAVIDLATMAGYPSSAMDVEDFDLDLPATGQASGGEWSLIPETGNKVGEWMDRLYNDYARTAYVGWVPKTTGRTFRFRTPESIGTTAGVTLYRTKEEAVPQLMTSMGITEPEAWKIAYRYVFQSWHEVTMEMEANALRVSGWDSRLDKSFQVEDGDVDSQKPDTLPSVRPANWLGEPRLVGLFDPAITSMGVALYALAVFKKRVMTQRKTAEVKCQLMRRQNGEVLWRGDCMRGDGKGRYRILTFSVECVLEQPDDRFVTWRPATYALEWEAA